MKLVNRTANDSMHPARGIDELLRGAGRLPVLVATAGKDGLPHLSTADRILPQPEGLVEISGWLCPTTIRNLRHNANLALVVRASQGSVQIEGKVDTMEEDAFLDGDAPGEESGPSVSQVRWILRIRPQRFFSFPDGLHSDEPLGGEPSPAST